MVPGWDKAIKNLSLGEMATIKMSAANGWGAAGIPGLIPPDADLEFEVELAGIQ